MAFSELHVAWLPSANAILHPHQLIDGHSSFHCMRCIAKQQHDSKCRQCCAIESIASYNITSGNTFMLGTDARACTKMQTWAILSMLWSFMTSLQVVPRRAAIYRPVLRKQLKAAPSSAAGRSTISPATRLGSFSLICMSSHGL